MKRRQFTLFACALLAGGVAPLYSVPAAARNYDERHQNRKQHRDSWIGSLDGKHSSRPDRQDRQDHHGRHDDQWKKRQKHRKSQRSHWQRSSGSDCSACW